MGGYCNPNLTKDQGIQTKPEQRNTRRSIIVNQRDMTEHFTQTKKINIPSSQCFLGTFCKISHMLGHKPSINRYKKLEITPCILSDHLRLKLCIINNSYKFMEILQLTTEIKMG